MDELISWYRDSGANWNAGLSQNLQSMVMTATLGTRKRANMIRLPMVRAKCAHAQEMRQCLTIIWGNASKRVDENALSNRGLQHKLSSAYEVSCRARA
jgi:hypothetical protein